jgi:hypothetical protein
MASPTPVAPQPRSANLFEFATHSGKTKITYYPFAPGPLVLGRTPGPSLQYDGPEGSLSFRDAQITQETTPLGQLLSVVLKPEADSGSLTFSLFLPPVAMGGNNSQRFTTYGVKTRHAGLAEKPGAQMTYETECLNGDAEVVMTPL